MHANKTSQQWLLYASQDNVIRFFHMDAYTGTLAEFGSITTPDTVQFAHVAPSRRHLYVALSNAGPGGKTGDRHCIAAYEIDQTTDTLHPAGALLAVPHRPIHLTTDREGAHVLVAHNKPATISICALDATGNLDSIVEQSESPKVGVFPHQVTVGVSGRSVFVCSRGNDKTTEKPADPGMVTSFNYNHGRLVEAARLQLPDGLGPRDLELHPSKPLAYISLERGNQLAVYSTEKEIIQGSPLFAVDTLRYPRHLHSRQRAGTAHLHPNGKFAYITNRADKPEFANGKAVLVGGENNLAVFALDDQSGKPTLIQHIETRGIEPRTFAIDPSGKWLVVGNQSPMFIRQGEGLVKIPPNLAVFSIQHDGKLHFVHRYDFNQDSELIWMNFINRV